MNVGKFNLRCRSFIISSSNYAGHLNPKSDVYSFGVVLLELLSGRRALDNERGGLPEETLVEWAIPFLKDNKRVLRIMDTRLGGQYSKKGAQAAAAVALQCLHSDPKNRPSMIDVLVALEQLHTSKDMPRTPPQVKVDHHGTKRTNHPPQTMTSPEEGTSSRRTCSCSKERVNFASAWATELACCRTKETLLNGLLSKISKTHKS
ncbi:hypothetical protein JRO89_XS10G0116300 [Xanthoceras sorbifolium]|uniref:Protein kinase domain-containing protein n=1 Tax=Xanthoceras sorbifolium TaxID=99658 RepID=A0ABQ8HIC3_9ROSI|nr:hypothetical protein JRO89_XS10G0116300 [Xanthoceras sorbifolium]